MIKKINKRGQVIETAFTGSMVMVVVFFILAIFIAMSVFIAALKNPSTADLQKVISGKGMDYSPLFEVVEWNNQKMLLVDLFMRAASGEEGFDEQEVGANVIKKEVEERAAEIKPELNAMESIRMCLRLSDLEEEKQAIGYERIKRDSGEITFAISFAEDCEPLVNSLVNINGVAKEFSYSYLKCSYPENEIATEFATCVPIHETFSEGNGK